MIYQHGISNMSQQFKTTTTTTTTKKKKTERHCAEWKKEPMSKKKSHTI